MPASNTNHTPNTSQSRASQPNANANKNATKKGFAQLFATYGKAFYSFWVILPMLFFYAISCAVATFIENDYGSVAAHTIVYGSWWFALLHIYLVIALIASFFHMRSWKRKKYASMLLHASFIVIIVGAGITRYFGKEGMIFIEEGKSSDFYYSNDNFINIAALNNEWQKDFAFMPANINIFGTLFSRPKIDDEVSIFGKTLSVRSTDLAMMRDDENPNKNKPMILHIDVAYNGEMKSIALVGGNGFSNEHAPVREEIGGMKFSLHWGSRRVELPFALRLLEFEKKTYAGTDNPSSYASEVEVLDKEGNIIKPFRIYMNHVLDFGGYRFYQSDYYQNEENGKYITVLSVNNDPGMIPTYIGYAMLMIGALWLLFDKKGRFMQLARFLSKAQVAQKSALAVVLLASSMGLKSLDAFPVDANQKPKIETHSSEPSAIIDTKGAESSARGMDSAKVDSSAQNAESKNADSALDSAAIQAPKGLSEQATRTLQQALQDAQTYPTQIDPSHIQERFDLLRENSQEFAKRLARIQIQDYQGRIMPLDTMAMNIVHKIYKKDGFKGLDNTQVIMGLMAFPQDWATMRLIDTTTPKLRDILGLPKGERYASRMDIYDPVLDESKLHNYFADTMQKAESEYNVFDKDIKSVTERFEILKSVQNLLYFRVFPDIKTQRWFSVSEIMRAHAFGEISDQQYEEMIKSIDPIMGFLLYGIVEGVTTNSWEKAIGALKALENYQMQNGGQNYLDESHVSWEIWLNHYNVFEKLTIPYILLGFLGFVLVLVYIYKDKPIPNRAYQVFLALVSLCVIAHTFGLGVRWYVSEHAPWSNAYESMIYIAWASGIAGVVFFRHFMLALCATSFLSGVSLFVAHLGYMEPQIQNLVPVLQSYWLNIHVSVITAGYGFLGLCFVLGAFGLILFALRSKNKPHIDKAILSVGAINEMSMILGLFMLTVGNFLGAIWANESWGRYWGWDAKETWALISIGIYAIVLHLRFVGFKNMPFVFAVGSVLAFYSILMTYFGVNYYLSGKHSYASGDPMPIPVGLYIFIALTIALIIIARFKAKTPLAKAGAESSVLLDSGANVDFVESSARPHDVDSSAESSFGAPLDSRK